MRYINIKIDLNLNKGMTLIETIIYIALLSLLMTGIFSSVYMVMSGEERQGSKNTEEDTILILEKYHE